MSRIRWRRSRSRWLVAVLLPASLLTLSPACSWSRDRARGERLFAGDEPLSARLVAHHETLPPEVVRCSNCHQKGSAGQSGATPTFGSTLSPESLQKPLARRGGPASSYDRERFCRLLRDGVDPASIVIPQTMPRYTLTASDCRALWAYLSAP